MSMSFSLSVLLLILFCIPTINFMVVFHHRVWISRANTAMAEEAKLTSVEFEVYGLVQGVFFRKNTVERGRQLGLRGWCMNTHRGTVLGLLEGEPVKVEEMKRWLKYTGSPMSKIEKAEFRNEKSIDIYSMNDFKVELPKTENGKFVMPTVENGQNLSVALKPKFVPLANPYDNDLDFHPGVKNFLRKH